MSFAPEQSEPPVLIAISHDVYAAATQAPNNRYDALDRRSPEIPGKTPKWLVFTGASESPNIKYARYGREMHQGLLAQGAQGALHDEDSRRNLFDTKACFPLTVSWEQEQPVKMLASLVEAETPEALAKQFPSAAVEVMPSAEHLRSACDSLQVQQRLGKLLREHKVSYRLAREQNPQHAQSEEGARGAGRAVAQLVAKTAIKGSHDGRE